jgi:hypothetical protein
MYLSVSGHGWMGQHSIIPIGITGGIIKLSIPSGIDAG